MTTPLPPRNSSPARGVAATPLAYVRDAAVLANRAIEMDRTGMFFDAIAHYTDAVELIAMACADVRCEGTQREGLIERVRHYKMRVAELEAAAHLLPPSSPPPPAATSAMTPPGKWGKPTHNEPPPVFAAQSPLKLCSPPPTSASKRVEEEVVAAGSPPPHAAASPGFRPADSSAAGAPSSEDLERLHALREEAANLAKLEAEHRQVAAESNLAALESQLVRSNAEKETALRALQQYERHTAELEGRVERLVRSEEKARIDMIYAENKVADLEAKLAELTAQFGATPPAVGAGSADTSSRPSNESAATSSPRSASPAHSSALILSADAADPSSPTSPLSSRVRSRGSKSSDDRTLTTSHREASSPRSPPMALRRGFDADALLETQLREAQIDLLHAETLAATQRDAWEVNLADLHCHIDILRQQLTQSREESKREVKHVLEQLAAAHARAEAAEAKERTAAGAIDAEAVAMKESIALHEAREEKLRATLNYERQLHMEEASETQSTVDALNERLATINEVHDQAQRMASARMYEMHLQYEEKERVLREEAEEAHRESREKKILNVLNKIMKQKQLMTTDLWKRNVQRLKRVQAARMVKVAEARQKVLNDAASRERKILADQRAAEAERAAEAIARSQAELAWKKKSALARSLGKVKKDEFIKEGIRQSIIVHRQSIAQRR